MTLTQIYDLFKTMTDAEEFASDTDFIAAMNLADATLRGERNWEALKKTVNKPVTITDLGAGITDMADLLRIWAVTGTNKRDKYVLTKAPWDKRYDEAGDYSYNVATKTIEVIHETTPTNWLTYQIDYKYRPAAFAALTETPTWLDSDYHGIYAYELVRIFKRADADFDFYKEYGSEYDYMKSLILSWNENLAGR